MIGRRNLTIALAMLPTIAAAQNPAAGWVGEWQGDVAGIGAARIVITGVKPSGQVEGRMEFTLQSFVSNFADKMDVGSRTNLGMVSGNALTIEAALGGTYSLVREGNSLKGDYTRGTTFKGPATFTRV